MITPSDRSEFCFATLALRVPYRAAAMNLANDLAIYAPGRKLIVLTDDPCSFQNHANVIVYLHRQQGLFNCWNDKRFAISAAFKHGNTVIFYDADTRISQPLPNKIEVTPPLSTDWTPNLEEQTIRYQNANVANIIFKTCGSFGVDPKQSVYIDDNFYVIRQDKGREIVFLKVWGKVAEQLDLEGIGANDGTCMGIAAAVVGWHASQDEVRAFDAARTHLLDGGKKATKKSLWERLLRRIIYRVLILKNRLAYVVTLK
jgi:hypothetical protein